MISVIIPTLNERKEIGECIENVLSEGSDAEVIVADGGSTDGTCEIVREYAGGKVRLVESGRGRGIQMNSGAGAARGEMILFLHADTRLEQGWGGAVKGALEDAETAGGAFSLRIDGEGSHFRLIETLVGLRCRLFSLPYGDQAIFLRKRTFVEIGAYREIPLMEDVDLIRRLKKTGRIAILDKKAFTAARRWEAEGWILTSARNQLIMLLYRLGVGPERLARMYYR